MYEKTHALINNETAQNNAEKGLISSEAGPVMVMEKSIAESIAQNSSKPSAFGEGIKTKKSVQ